MFEDFFRRNNFDLLYQALRWQDAVAAAFEKRLSENVDSIFEQLIRKKLALGDEQFFHFQSARHALASIFKNVSSDRNEVLVASFTCEVVPAYIIKSGLTPVFYPCSPLKRIDYELCVVNFVRGDIDILYLVPFLSVRPRTCFAHRVRA